MHFLVSDAFFELLNYSERGMAAIIHRVEISYSMFQWGDTKESFRMKYLCLLYFQKRQDRLC